MFPKIVQSIPQFTEHQAFPWKSRAKRNREEESESGDTKRRGSENKEQLKDFIVSLPEDKRTKKQKRTKETQK